MLHHEGSLVEAAEVLDRAPGCIVGPGPTAYVLHLNPTPICLFACHGDDNDDDNDDDNADTVVDQRFFYSSMHNCTRQYSGLIIRYL